MFAKKILISDTWVKPRIKENDSPRTQSLVALPRQDEENRGRTSDALGFSCSSTRSRKIPRFARDDATGARALNEKRRGESSERTIRTHVQYARGSCVRACAYGTKRNGTKRRGDRGRPRGSRGEKVEKRHIHAHIHTYPHTRTRCHGVNVNDACRAYYEPSATLPRSEVPVIHRRSVAGQSPGITTRESDGDRRPFVRRRDRERVSE